MLYSQYLFVHNKNIREYIRIYMRIRIRFLFFKCIYIRILFASYSFEYLKVDDYRALNDSIENKSYFNSASNLV